MEEYTRVGIYDADFIPFYVCYNKKGEEPKTLEQCIELTDSLIDTTNKLSGCTEFIGYVTKGKCFRYDINPSYKANRKGMVYPEHAAEIREYLIDKYQFQKQEGYEADDLVISAYRQIPGSIIISPDKDLLKSVPLAYNPRIHKFVRNTPLQINKTFWSSMITGDVIDGIKGIPGKGPAAAKQIVKGRNGYREKVLSAYCEHFGEYEGIKEFTKNYLSLKLVDNITLGNIKINYKTEVCEQENESSGEQT